MGEAVAGVHIDISAETAKLEEGVKKAQAVLRNLKKQGEADGKAVGDAIVGAFTRIGASVAAALGINNLVQFGLSALEAGANVKRFSDQAGLTTTQFQELQFALRDTGVQGEQMAAAFAAFGRNLSDLQRGTGGLLSFLRESAPQFIRQFHNVKDANEGFTLLASILSKAKNTHDGLRLAQAAGGEQMAKMAGEAARLGPALDQARLAAHEAGRVISERQAEDLRKAQRAWKDFGDTIVIQTGRLITATQQAFTGINRENAEALEADIRRLEVIKRSQETLGRNTDAVTAQIQRQKSALEELRLAADNVGAAPPPAAAPDDGWTARNNAIKAAQGALQLYMAQLNQLPSQANFVSEAYIGAWRRMEAAMAASGATDAQRAAARIQLIQQESQARQQALGNAMMADEQLTIRGQELALRRQQGILTETEYQRALNLARSEYGLAQMQELQGLGVTLSFQEQHLLSIERINNALATGKITTEQAGRAHQAAAMTAASAWAGAMGNVAGALAQAFPKQKAFAVAAAMINVAEGITKSLSLPFPLNWAQAAAVAASGLAQINAIKSANPGSSGSVPSVGGGVAGAGAAAEPAMPTQMLTLNLHGSRFSRDDVEDLVEQMGEYFSDGGGGKMVQVIRG